MRLEIAANVVALSSPAVAEGVETEAQRDVLSQAGCDVVQGFLYAPPLPTAAFERLVERRTRPDGAQVPVAAGTP